MSVLERLPEVVYPLTQVNKVNEIVDVINTAINSSYTALNPTLTPVDGSATWDITHNLGTENVSCSIYNGDNVVIVKTSIVSENAISVTFNTTSVIPAETYKVVIIAQGSISSSGGGGGSSYILPMASTTTLGGVKIDNSTIGISNEGVISSPILYKTLANGTVINVKTDGSGDFTSLNDAYNYVKDKCCAGTVTIQLGSGTFTISNTLNFTETCNIHHLIIKGNGESNTTISINNKDGIINRGANSVTVQSLKLQNSYSSKTKIGIYSYTNGVMNLNAVTINNFDTGVVAEGADVKLTGVVTVSNCTTGLRASGSFIFGMGSNTYLTNISGTGLVVWWHGTITLMGGTVTKNNVAKLSSITLNTTNPDGYINIFNQA